MSEDHQTAFERTKSHVFEIAFRNLEASFREGIGENDEAYGFIPFPNDHFVQMLIEASVHFKMDRAKKFLDIGSGPGTKVMLASVLFDSYGIELKKRLVLWANQLGVKNVTQNDALKFENYGDYDLLYFYRPLKTKTLQEALEERIFDQMKPGALIAPMRSEMNWDVKATKISDFLYLKE